MDLVENHDFKAFYPALMPDKLQKGSKDFPTDTPALEWLKYKSFAVVHAISDDEISNQVFAENVLHEFRLLHPFNHYINHAISMSGEL
jgi:uncharacterized protein (DUF2461 family)